MVDSESRTAVGGCHCEGTVGAILGRIKMRNAQPLIFIHILIHIYFQYYVTIYTRTRNCVRVLGQDKVRPPPVVVQ